MYYVQYVYGEFDPESGMEALPRAKTLPDAIRALREAGGRPCDWTIWCEGELCAAGKVVTPYVKGSVGLFMVTDFTPVRQSDGVSLPATTLYHVRGRLRPLYKEVSSNML